MPLLSSFSRFIFFGTLILIAGVVFLGRISVTQAASTSLPITGYAWSDYLGWIHFNGSNYGVYEDSSTGLLSGYAWSPYFGWISFQDLSGCPSGTCNAQVNLSTGSVTGWARSCASFSNKNACSGTLEVGAGGWDGWIHLSPTSGSVYGVTSTNGCWSGYAYGSQDIGYIKFAGTAGDGSIYKVGDSSCSEDKICSNGANNYPTCTTCTPPLSWDSSSLSCVACSNGGCTPTSPIQCNSGANNPPACNTFTPSGSLSADSYDINVSSSTILHWSCTNATSYSGTSPIGNGSWPGNSSVSTGLLPQGAQPYQLTCSGSGGTSPIYSISINVHSSSVSITADPTRVRSGGQSVISWSATDVKNNSCSVSGPGIPSRTGFSSVATTSDTAYNISTQSTYTITCKNIDNVSITNSVMVNVIPAFQEF